MTPHKPQADKELRQLLARRLLLLSPTSLGHLILALTVLAAVAQYPVKTQLPPAVGAWMFVAVLISGVTSVMRPVGRGNRGRS